MKPSGGGLRVKRLGRLLSQQAAPFYSSCLLLPVGAEVSVFSLAERHYATLASVKNNFPSSQFFNGNFGTNWL